MVRVRRGDRPGRGRVWGSSNGSKCWNGGGLVGSWGHFAYRCWSTPPRCDVAGHLVVITRAIYLPSSGSLLNMSFLLPLRRHRPRPSSSLQPSSACSGRSSSSSSCLASPCDPRAFPTLPDWCRARTTRPPRAASPRSTPPFTRALNRSSAPSTGSAPGSSWCLLPSSSFWFRGVPGGTLLVGCSRHSPSFWVLAPPFVSLQYHLLGGRGGLGLHKWHQTFVLLTSCFYN